MSFGRPARLTLVLDGNTVLSLGFDPLERKYFRCDRPRNRGPPPPAWTEEPYRVTWCNPEKGVCDASPDAEERCIGNTRDGVPDSLRCGGRRQARDRPFLCGREDRLHDRPAYDRQRATDAAQPLRPLGGALY